MLKKIKSLVKMNYRYILAAFIGALVSLIFYPIQKNIDYSFWLKQDKVTKEEKVFDKKLELIDDFNTTLSTFSLCSWKSSANISGNIYNPTNVECFWINRAKLNSDLDQISLFFGNEMGTNIDIFRKTLDSYEKGVSASFGGEMKIDEKDPKFQEFFYNYLNMLKNGKSLTDKMYQSLNVD